MFKHAWFLSIVVVVFSAGTAQSQLPPPPMSGGMPGGGTPGGGTPGGGMPGGGMPGGGILGVEFLNQLLHVDADSIVVSEEASSGIVTSTPEYGLVYVSFDGTDDSFQVHAQSPYGPVTIRVNVDPTNERYVATYEGECLSTDLLASEPDARIVGVVNGDTECLEDDMSLIFGSVDDMVLTFSGNSSRALHVFDGIDTRAEADQILSLYDSSLIAGAIYLPPDVVVQMHPEQTTSYRTCSIQRRMGWIEFLTGCAAGAVTGGAVTAVAGPGILVGAVAGCIVGGGAAVIFDPDPNESNPGHSVVVGGVGGLVAAGVICTGWPPPPVLPPPDPGLQRYNEILQRCIDRGHSGRGGGWF